MSGSLYIQGQIYEFTSAQRFGGLVNTSADESNPVLSEDGLTFYFVRTFDPKNQGGIYDQDIWKSNLVNGQWMIPSSVKSLNNKLNNAVVAERISPADSSLKQLFLISSYGLDRDLEKGITLATSKLNDTTWIIKNKLPISGLDIDGKYVGYCISEDQSVIIISYEGSDSEGEEDLYYSLKQEGGWSEPESLGGTLNSSGFEISPFLSKTNDTLFFASNGFKGLGDADIFYSVKKGKWNSWSKPVNLGKTINTPHFDAYFSLRGNQAIWASNRDGKDMDIWSAFTITPPELILEIKEIKNVSEFQGMDGSIEIDVVSGIKPFKYTWSNGQSTEDIFNLRRGEYKLTVTDSIGQKLTQVFTVDEPAAKEQNIIRFPNVQYEFNKWTFINDASVNSFDSLKIVAKLLEDYPNLSIELISHTDARGEMVRNQVLSENRAKACYIYLVKQLKIDPRRIVPVGKGETEPTQWYDPDQKAYVKLTEEFILSKKNNEELYEYLNQLNRRTEGRVLRLDFDPKTAPEAPKENMEFQSLP